MESFKCLVCWSSSCICLVGTGISSIFQVLETEVFIQFSLCSSKLQMVNFLNSSFVSSSSFMCGVFVIPSGSGKESSRFDLVV